MTRLLHKELTGAIIGIYYDVYNGTGRTYPEYIYENAMALEFRNRGIPCERQKEYQIEYEGQLVGVQQLDLFTANEVVVELKVVPALTRLHKAQALSYLKVAGKQVGLLFNFGSPEPEFERLFFHDREPDRCTEAIRQAADQVPSHYLAPDLVYDIVGGLFRAHSALGPGFIYRIYANACYHELAQRGLEVQAQKKITAFYRGRPIGNISLNHLRVTDVVFVFPVAIQHIDDLSINNLKAWMRAEGVPLGIVANFDDIRLRPLILREQGS